ncbi:OmpP1/FadL family transporter [Legionella clemsonensis]|uniref:Outer membrane protein transport protein (OMPP1/FadL/TodX) n=1 Tax=Legionella clemsonensis TaxID=1867846 RepID=A0A222P0C9_9GAMM|nr:outer membrane protein transport protein [Legionella clemsonensis]ASQ45292.1 Outer membrane protein transport protein (OMPP1/FadL/TodX) [Legionella clemsonensis]
MRYSLAIILSLSSIGSYANVLQYFAGISYSNPAELFKVKKNEFLIGGTGFYGDVRFAGSVLNLNTFQYDSGVSASRRFSFLPYGRIASRINQKLVWGVDVTQPFHSNLIYGLDAFTRYAATETLMTDVDISPRFSYNIVPQLTIGAGLNFNFLKDNETNWALPVSQTQYAMFINRTSGFGIGYDAGVYFMANSNNFLGATYYSAIKQKTRGESILNGNVSTDLRFNFRMPATTILHYTHLFSQKWLASFQIFCSEWNANQFARIQNTAAPPPAGPNFTFTMKYNPSWAYSAAIRQQYSENLGLTLIGLLDNGPERDHLRTINFPSDTQYFLGLATDYHLSKLTTLELLYGHVFSKTLIGNYLFLNGQQFPFTTGRVRINAEVFELRIKLQA